MRAGTHALRRTFAMCRSLFMPVRHMTAPGGSGPPTDGGLVWADVVSQYSDVIYTMAYRLTGNDEEARDLAQDVLIRLHRSLDRYREGNFEGWLYRTTTNAFRDRLRKRKRLREDALPESVPRRLASTQNVEQMAVQSELRDVVQAALIRLPPDYREVIVLRDLQGRSYEEIGESLGIPPGTVRSRIHRGREALRELLAPYMEGER